jgi:hypothetical protein
MADQDEILALHQQFLDFVTVYGDQLKGIFTLMTEQTHQLSTLVEDVLKVVTVLNEDPKFKERFNKLASAEVKNKTVSKELQKLEAGLAAFLEKNKGKIH